MLDSEFNIMQIFHLDFGILFSGTKAGKKSLTEICRAFDLATYRGFLDRLIFDAEKSLVKFSRLYISVKKSRKKSG